MKNIPIPGTEPPDVEPKPYPLGIFAEASQVEDEIVELTADLAEADEAIFGDEPEAPEIMMIPPKQKGVPQAAAEPWPGDVVRFKAGHDYLWYLFGPRVAGGTGNKTFVRVPIAWYVEQIYWRADHSLLGLPD